MDASDRLMVFALIAGLGAYLFFRHQSLSTGQLSGEEAPQAAQESPVSESISGKAGIFSSNGQPITFPFTGAAS